MNIGTDIESSPDPILVDGEQLKQVLLNLGLNGIQAMQPGGTLRFRVRPLGDFIDFEVVDDGKGIPEDDLERVFNPFYTSRPEGTGMGLPIAYRIVTQHGGHIIVRRNELRGMTFVVRIPRQEMSAKA